MTTDFLSIRIKEEEAREIAMNLYKMEGEIISLPGELDFNFRIKTTGGDYILKISRPGVEKDFLQYQTELLNHISVSGAQLNLPEVIRDIEGHQLSEYSDSRGDTRYVRMLSWIEGRLWSSVNPINNELLFSLGAEAGKITDALQGFDHPVAHREFQWDIDQAAWTFDFLPLLNDRQREIVSYFHQGFKNILGRLASLRKGIVHNDVNDNNVIVSDDLIHTRVKAIIDFGDAIHTRVINDLAVVLAYAMMNKPDVLSAAIPIVRGYHKAFPLEEEELDMLYILMAMRLVISVTKSAINKQQEPDNEYLLISEKPAWEALEKWKEVSPGFAHYSFRKACGFPAHPQTDRFKEWAKSQSFNLSQFFPTIKKTKCHKLDLGMQSGFLGHDSDFNNLFVFEFNISQLQKQFPDKILAGGYLETRPVYGTDEYKKEGNDGPEYRSVHLGIDYWLPAGTPVHALFDGTVFLATDDAGYKKYGGLIILQHEVDELTFYTLYGHQSVASVYKLKKGEFIAKGDRISQLGAHDENGKRGTHLHFQVILDMPGNLLEFPGVAYPDQKEAWADICPDPNLLFKDKNLVADRERLPQEMAAFRKQHLGKSLSLSYADPLHIIRGDGVFLIDTNGRRFLDTVNNVAHVGHEHPRVVKAGQQQMSLLNTNTRYLHENINKFAEELLGSFPDELSVVHFVNSGSEANELALRMAKIFTSQKDIIAMEVGYHGNTGACVDISSYKFDGKGGKGAPEHTHIVPLPDAYRGIYQGENTGPKYVAHVNKQIENIHAKGRNVAAFICESIISCGGQIELPEGFLASAYKSVRNAGGLCIADEVQVGCGRVGSHFWGFQLHAVIPDIVTIGKPIGNGHPLAAVVCTRNVADAFANGMEYFNTFGGNPVSCAIGREVLHVIKDEKLQENALEVGNYLKAGLKELQGKVPIIGDVRGQGLFLGFELAGKNKTPLTDKAAYLTNRMRELGILMSTDGKDENVLKIKPPMVFSKENADELLCRLKAVFDEDFMKS